MLRPVAYCFKRFPLLSRLTLWCLLPLAAALLMLRNELVKSVPQYQGQLNVAGLTAPVTIAFDQQGLADVSAGTDRDAYFAQGYLHASERMWQMVVQRRLLYGRLSEVFGRKTVASDRWMRTLGLKAAAEQVWQHTSGAPREALEAYAAGVNAWLGEDKPLPPEFLFFGLTPEPWQPQDSLAWQKAFALNLGQNFRMEILRLNALKLMDAEQLLTFFPYDSCLPQAKRCNAPAPEAIAWTDDKGSANEDKYPSWQALEQEMVKTFGLGERFVGSNGWAVAGRHTQSGLPLLANDPHLSIAQPSQWYAIAMRGDKLNVKGMSLVGMPGVMLGRNEHISWGATSLMGDNQDLFILDVPLKDQQAYRLDGQTQLMNSHQEQIHIRADSPKLLNKDIEPLTITVRSAEFGPIISDVVATDGKAMALRWAALDAQDTSFDAFYQLQYAQDWQAFRQALSLLGAPGLNFLYADSKGNIGAQVAGKLPVRATGDGSWPQFARSQKDDWQGYVPFEQLPSSYNPPSGYVLSANNRIASEAGVNISHEWAPETRAQRIEQLLKAAIAKAEPMSLDAMVAMQKDEVDIAAKAQLDWLVSHGVLQQVKQQTPENNHQAVTSALEVLFGWDGSYAIDSTGATVYHFWLDSFKSNLFKNVLLNNQGNQSERRLLDSLLPLVSQQSLLVLLQQDDSLWCEALKPSSCQQLLVDSFYQSIEQLVKHFDTDDVSQWQWGEVHYVEFAHQPFGQVRLLEKWFSKRFASGGSNDTLNVGSALKDDDGNYRQDFGAVFRHVFDMGSAAQDYQSWGAGQSGHFLSRFYDDKPVAFYRPFTGLTERQVVSTLLLLPGQHIAKEEGQ